MDYVDRLKIFQLPRKFDAMRILVNKRSVMEVKVRLLKLKIR